MILDVLSVNSKLLITNKSRLGFCGLSLVKYDWGLGGLEFGGLSLGIGRLILGFCRLLIGILELYYEILGLQVVISGLSNKCPGCQFPGDQTPALF
jgi:hypothetical protein